MERSIVGFHADAEGDWVAELDCGHCQHVRHRPPFQERPWVLDAPGRAGRLGTPIDCPLCTRAELPEGLRVASRSPTWDAESLPSGLRRSHRLAHGRWGRLVVERGRLVFSARTSPPIERVVQAGEDQAIPPEIGHHVEPSDDARLWIEFLEVVPYARGSNEDESSR